MVLLVPTGVALLSPTAYLPQGLDPENDSVLNHISVEHESVLKV